MDIGFRTRGLHEFADLFTTLARSIGIPTQTVFGIVYEAGEFQMAFHAWNEIEINENIIEIDPTAANPSRRLTH